ncbi:unnamed protein product [Caenorhabditis angaria]|uniref:J domain-containing protein n=1 Tax=Caenorhabditis angaria TaxID=860376 RepID=A0A9P1I9C4_9PELO|nr:unnamed protein product [Caenorhabditis angaria]
MMKIMFVDDCETHFNTKCLYGVLGVEKTCTNSELKKAYYKQSMRWHPDKSSLEQENKELYTIKFQILNKTYTILSDKEKRAIYDETGKIADENEETTQEEMMEAWRKVFKKVTKEDIDNYMREFEGSAEQKRELIEKYEEFDGDFEKIQEYVLGENLKEILDELIANGELKATKKYKSSTSLKKQKSRKLRAEKEAEEAEKVLREMEASSSSSLESMILARNAKRGAQMDSFFDSLAEKYAPKKSKKK